jgi:glyoxylase-like metal-dependent hydrolase (beta-lactamase superfamily II)
MPADPAAIKLRCLTTGEVRQKAGDRGVRRYVLDCWKEDTLPVNVFVIEHPDGVCVFDSGQTARAAAPGYLPRWHPFLRLARFELGPEEEAGSQLARLGIDPADVRWLVLSHLHTDHVGGVDAFRNAEILVTRTEWGLASGLGGRLRGYLPQHWPSGTSASMVDFTGPPIGPFPGSHDVAGDGELMLVPTPGHTRGHMAMIVRGEHGRGYLCCGDLVSSAAALSESSPAIARFCRDHNLIVLTTHDWNAPALLAGQLSEV